MRGTVFYHADDFGVSNSQSASIIECYEQGILNSVSIMPNSPKLFECYDMIKQSYDEGKIRCVIHLNFIEGPCMANPESIPDLVDDKGDLINSFGSILKMNYSLKRAIYKEQIKLEIIAQMAAVANLLGTKKVSVDSHQHFHMIPIVWEALQEAIKEEGYQVEYIRISLDPMSILITTPAVWKDLRVINLVKWAVLKFLGPSRKQLTKTGAKIPVFFGIFYTCEMKLDVVRTLLPKYQKYAVQRDRDLELMFHPGAVFEKSELLDATNQELVEFYASSNREAEKITLMTLKP